MRTADRPDSAWPDAVQKFQLFDGVRQNSSTSSPEEKTKPSRFGGESWSASDRSRLDRTWTKNTQRRFCIRPCERNESAAFGARSGSRAENEERRLRAAITRGGIEFKTGDEAGLRNR